MLLKFLDVDYFCKSYKQVTSTMIITKGEKFHDEGLFSEIIFGKEKTKERKTTFGYINLNVKVMHPAALSLLLKVSRNVKKFLSTEVSFSLDSAGRLIEDPKGVTGIHAFIELFPKINFKASEVGAKVIELLKKAYKDEVLFIDKIPVIPPAFRELTKDPKTGEIRVEEINNYYIQVLKRSLGIKSIATSEGPLKDLLTYGIQNSIMDLDGFIRTKLSKKFGLIREQLMGKRIDFSARAVIMNGPDLKVNEIGVPFTLAVGLFEPFIIHNLLYTDKFDKAALESEILSFMDQPLSVDSIKKALSSIISKDVVPDELYKIIFEATKMAMEGRLVLAKRDPVLIPESVRAFTPILISGSVIRINNFQTGGFNADFDGDQMAIFHPLSSKAQEDSKKLLRDETGTNMNSISYELSKESVLGTYLLTKNYEKTSSTKVIHQDDLKKISDPAQTVKFGSRTTTFGKAVFNSLLPENYGFINIPVTKKVINNIISNIFKTRGSDVAKKFAFDVQTVGYAYATYVASSITIDMIDIPQSIMKLKAKLDKVDPTTAADIIEQMKKLMIEHLKDTGLYDLCESGASKGWDQPTQILIAKGVIADVEGNLLKPIKGSFSEGLTPKEYFAASLGARKGIVDRVINTADTGYTSRQLAYLLNGVELDWLKKDCGTTRTIQIKLVDDLIKKLEGRYVVEKKKVVPFDKTKYKSGDVINLRTPIYCTSQKICHTCYGDLLKRHRTPYVGLVAAQIIGERGTQLIMRAFHTGGAVKIVTRDILKELFDNDPNSDKNHIHQTFKQEGSMITTLKEGTLTLSFDQYSLNDDLIVNEEEDNIWVKSLLGVYETTDGIKINVILDCEVNTLVHREFIFEKKNKIVVQYEEGEEIFEIPVEKQEVKEIVLYMRRLIGGGEIFKDTPHLLMKLYRLYADLSDMDLVHMEIVVSQCLRDRERPILPARLGKNPDDPVMFNIKKTIFTGGFLQGLAFENTNEAISSGLTNKYELPPSVLEKILTGTLVEDEKNK